MSDQEVWKDVLGFYSGYYKVSNLGRVMRSVNGSGTFAGKILRPGFDKNGYLQVNLCKSNVTRTFKVHKLVAEAFIGPRPHKHEINHKDADIFNNIPDNLEYVSNHDNTIHALKMELRPAVKLSYKIAENIRQEIRSGVSKYFLSKKYGVSYSAIYRVEINETWCEAS